MATEPANMSQVFAWRQDTGVVEPLWNGTASSRMACPPSSGGGTPSSTVAAGPGDGSPGSPSPQSVILVFDADPTIGNSTATAGNNTTSFLPSDGGNSTLPDDDS